MATDGDEVFEALGGDEGDFRAFAFEERVGGDGGSVNHIRATCGDAADAFEDNGGGRLRV
jgi:hypothetical protein